MVPEHNLKILQQCALDRTYIDSDFVILNDSVHLCPSDSWFWTVKSNNELDQRHPDGRMTQLVGRHMIIHSCKIQGITWILYVFFVPIHARTLACVMLYRMQSKRPLWRKAAPGKIRTSLGIWSSWPQIPLGKKFQSINGNSLGKSKTGTLCIWNVL